MPKKENGMLEILYRNEFVKENIWMFMKQFLPGSNTQEKCPCNKASSQQNNDAASCDQIHQSDKHPKV